MVTIEIQASVATGGRRGVLRTAHGEVPTPAFMPVGTNAAVRGVTPAQLRETGAAMVLANAYHLTLRPGAKTISKLGGLHRFMGWDGPILTDSGGYQLFSLASSVKVDEEGAVFRSHLDGAAVQLTPERAVEIQTDLGVDIGMAFDVMSTDPRDHTSAATTAQRTLRWARRTADVADPASATSLFAIQQGGLFEDLRDENSAALAELDFPGYAVGGLSVGEAPEDTLRVAEHAVAALPTDKPRYMMGMGTPTDLVRLAEWGYDLFDCVIPTRNGRTGTLFTKNGTLAMRNAEHATADEPVESDCDCYACSNFSRAYIHHLIRRREMLGATLGTLHNLRFYQRLMESIREALARDAYPAFRSGFLASYQGGAA